VEVRLSAQAPEDHAQAAAQLIDEADKFCVIGIMLREAGIQIDARGTVAA